MADLNTLNAQVKAAIQADPQLADLAQRAGVGKGATLYHQQFIERLLKDGIQLSPDIDWNPGTGQFEPRPGALKQILLGIAAGATVGLAGPAIAALTGGGTTAGLGGVEAGATSGLGSAALPGAMATLPAVGGAAALPGAMATLPALEGAAAPAAATTAGLGPSTAANMAATDAALSAGAPAALIPPIINKVAGSSALGWLGLIGQIATPVVGGLIASNANQNATDTAVQGQLEAAKIQAQSTKDALDFAKQGYVEQQKQLAPYVGTGGAAITKLSQLTGLGTPAPYQVPPMLQNLGSAPSGATNTSGLQPSPPTSTSGATGSPSTSTGPLVSLRAPTGEIAQKPASEVQHWLSLGATVVPGSQPTLGVTP